MSPIDMINNPLIEYSDHSKQVTHRQQFLTWLEMFTSVALIPLQVKQRREVVERKVNSDALIGVRR